MRWIASLVVLGLMAATGARPVAPRTDRHDAAISDAHGLAASVAVRRAAGSAPDTRLDLYVITPALRFGDLPQVSPIAAGDLPARPLFARSIERSARGPPIG